MINTTEYKPCQTCFPPYVVLRFLQYVSSVWFQNIPGSLLLISRSLGQRTLLPEHMTVYHNYNGTEQAVYL